jgi:hypothetical protein
MQTCSRIVRVALYDGNDDVVLVMSRTAGSMTAQLGREFSPGAGDGVLVSTADVIRVHLATMLQCPALTLSCRTLAPLVTGLEDAFMRPVPRDTEALRLLMRYIRPIEDQQSSRRPDCVTSWSITSMISRRSRSARRAMLLRLRMAAARTLRACVRSRRKSSTT